MSLYPGFWLLRGCGEHARDHAPLFSVDLGNSLHWVGVQAMFRLLTSRKLSPRVRKLVFVREDFPRQLVFSIPVSVYEPGSARCIGPLSISS